MSQNLNKKIPLYCKDCRVEIFVDLNMVMLKNALWVSVCDDYKDAYCDHCIENRLGRVISENDFKLDEKNETPLCNLAWKWRKERFAKTLIYHG